MFKEMAKYKELVYFLVHKEIRLKYRNSFFGFFWSLLEPLGLMVIYTLVFSVITKFGREIDNYPLYVLSGLIPWTFLSNSMHQGAKSLTKNSALIKKIFFPRQIFPLTTVLANLVNFIPALFLVVILAIVTEWDPSLLSRILVLPAIVLLQALFILSITIILSVLNVFYKDVELILTVALRAWMYLSPIIYSINMVQEQMPQYFGYYLLNPMAIILSLYRWVFFSEPVIGWQYIVYTVVGTVVFFFIAWKLFNRINRRVGEII